MKTTNISHQAENTPPQAIILTGPSSCGKGSVAEALCATFNIPHEHWLSMGAILRSTFERAPRDAAFAGLLADKYAISNHVELLTSPDATPELTAMVEEHADGVGKMLAEKTSRAIEGSAWQSVSQLEWLEYCTSHGLLNPDRWTQCLIAAHIETIPDVSRQNLIIDGYPRTVGAARHLLEVFEENGVNRIRVLHMRIAKDEMMSRAAGRGRLDDTRAALERRYRFYEEEVVPCIAHLEGVLGANAVAVINAHQPHFDETPDGQKFNLEKSIANVVASAFKALDPA
ncbi:MAG: nucleoside monophosphate kinase [Alphaproteobacteria bacterium]